MKIWYNYNKLIRYLGLRLNFISEVSKDVAQVVFAALVIESFTKGNVSWHLVFIGIVLSAVFWIIGIISYKIK